ncbi:ArsA family ATPase [Nocardia noduli]|uniref:ArsA family ATPase n=1 Tax=Nocardia noduli TaxID=2815722 RepID=UPI0027E172E5|nr:ArsA family ATPase [Nocardia noduli]
MGKGGVGKTTLACATAIAHARAGRRALLASLDQSHSLGDAFGFRFPHDAGTIAGIVNVAPDLDVIELDSLALLEDRFREVVHVLGADTGHDHGIDIAALDPAELTGLPGVQELLMLVEVAQLASEDDWDVIVLDCPPSADTLRVLSAPPTLLGYVERIWPPHARTMSGIGADLRRAVLAATVERIVAAVTEVNDLLGDHDRTEARLVTLAEQLAVAETARLRSAAVLLGLRVTEVIVNKVLPPAPPPSGPSEHPAAHWYLNRRAEQLDVIARMRQAVPGIPVLTAQHTGSEPVGYGSLSALSYAVDAHPMLGDNPTEVREVHASSAVPMVRCESGTGLHSVYSLRLPLPVADPATLRLGRVEDDLIVGADGVRRRVRLAPVLRRCMVDGAELDDGYLVVRFVPDPEMWPR